MITRSGIVGTAVATLITAAGFAHAEDRKYTYACEVQTQSGIAGLVMVQADTLDKAEGAAKNALAHTLAGERSQTMSVVECIQPAADQRFVDSGFQAFYERFPR